MNDSTQTETHLYPPILHKEGRHGGYLGQHLELGVRLISFRATDPADHHGCVLPYFTLAGQVHAAWTAEYAPDTPRARPETVATVGNGYLQIGLDSTEYALLLQEIDRVWETPEGLALFALLAERTDHVQERTVRPPDDQVRPALLYAQGGTAPAQLVYLWRSASPHSDSEPYAICQRIPGLVLSEISAQEIKTIRGGFLGWTSRNGGLYHLGQAQWAYLERLQRARGEGRASATPSGRAAPLRPAGSGLSAAGLNGGNAPHLTPDHLRPDPLRPDRSVSAPALAASTGGFKTPCIWTEYTTPSPEPGTTRLLN